MVTLETFTKSLQEAILGAHSALRQSQTDYLDYYFEEIPSTASTFESQASFTDQLVEASQAIHSFIQSSTRKNKENFYATLLESLEALDQAAADGLKPESTLVLGGVIRDLESLISSIKKSSFSADSLELSQATELLKHIEVLQDSIKSSQTGTANESSLNNPNTPTLRAKTVKVQYPQQTNNGLTTIDVTVPLITLVSLNSLQIEELKMRIGLELSLDQNTLMLNLIPSSGQTSPPSDPNSQTTSSFIEVTFAPTDSPEGIKKLVAGFEKALRAQLPH